MTNKIFALIGPNGSGKTLLASMLIQNKVHYIPYYTTRAFRKNDPAGTLCRHVNRWDFPKEDLIVRVTRQGDSYGMQKKDVLHALGHYEHSFMLLDPAGIPHISRILADSLVTIFLMVDYATALKRLLKMGYTGEALQYQLQYAETNREFENWKRTDYVVKNIHEPEKALQQIFAIMGLVEPVLSPRDA